MVGVEVIDGSEDVITAPAGYTVNTTLMKTLEQTDLL